MIALAALLAAVLAIHTPHPRPPRRTLAHALVAAWLADTSWRDEQLYRWRTLRDGDESHRTARRAMLRAAELAPVVPLIGRPPATLTRRAAA